MAGKFAVVAIGNHFGKAPGENVGYFDHRRIKVGEKLMVTEQQFSERWMERLTEKEEKQVVEQQADLEADAKRSKPKKSSSVL